MMRAYLKWSVAAVMALAFIGTSLHASSVQAQRGDGNGIVFDEIDLCGEVYDAPLVTGRNLDEAGVALFANDAEFLYVAVATTDESCELDTSAAVKAGFVAEMSDLPFTKKMNNVKNGKLPYRAEFVRFDENTEVAFFAVPLADLPKAVFDDGGLAYIHADLLCDSGSESATVGLNSLNSNGKGTWFTYTDFHVNDCLSLNVTAVSPETGFTNTAFDMSCEVENTSAEAVGSPVITLQVTDTLAPDSPAWTFNSLAVTGGLTDGQITNSDVRAEGSSLIAVAEFAGAELAPGATAVMTVNAMTGIAADYTVTCFATGANALRSEAFAAVHIEANN